MRRERRQESRGEERDERREQRRSKERRVRLSLEQGVAAAATVRLLSSNTEQTLSSPV